MHYLLSRAVILTMLALAPLSASAVTIDTVPIGNPGNPNDPAHTAPYGAVDYNYSIGKFEVTTGQYTDFLNAVAATDTYSLYSTPMAIDFATAGISRSGSSGSFHYSVIGSANKPITRVGFGDVARFCNWLANGQPGLGGSPVPQNAASTEDGSYLLNGANTDDSLFAITRRAGAQWVIPLENEWYKAAYHKNDGATGNYWHYPTSADSQPTAVPPPGDSNSANYFRAGVTDSLANVGAYTLAVSPYGTFDQGGNVSEWTETGFGGHRKLRGGFWGSPGSFLESGFYEQYQPTLESPALGFRVAFVAEPSTFGLAAVALLIVSLVSISSAVRTRTYPAIELGAVAIRGDDGF